MENENAALDAVTEEPAAKSAGGILDHFALRDAEFQWFPFPGLENAEIEICYHESPGYTKWRRAIEAKYRDRQGKVETDIWTATMPRGYALHLTRGWRTKDGNGGWIPRVDLGRAPGAGVGVVPQAPFYRVRKNSKKKIDLVKEDVIFDVGPDGFLLPTSDNRQKVFEIFGTIMGEIAEIALDAEVFAKPDEEGLRGN